MPIDKDDNIKNDVKKSIDEIAAACSDCGNCLFSCPVYNAELVEPFAPRGRVNLVKALRDGRLEPTKENRDYIYRCLLCGSCQHTCTKGVDFVDMMIDYRVDAAKGKKIPFLKKMILYFYQSFLFKKGGPVVDVLAKTPLRKKIMLPVRRKGSLERWRAQKGKSYDILLFPGCVLNYFYPGIIEKTAGFLEQNGYSVVIPRKLTCCGFPYLSQGWKKKFTGFRDANKAIFEEYEFKHLVVPCGTGVMTFRDYYGLKEPPFGIYELTRFFYQFLKEAPVKSPGDFQGEFPLTFHDPCHHLKTLGLADAPRHFLKQYGDKFVDNTDGLCCGFGGIFSVGFPSTSKKILKRKEEQLKNMGARTVVTACPGCYLHLKERLPREIGVEHFIDMFL